MADISMCSHPTCALRANCYRHERSGTRPSAFRQAYASFEPDDDGQCEAYWPITDADRLPLVDIDEPDLGRRALQEVGNG